LTDLLNIGVFV